MLFKSILKPRKEDAGISGDGWMLGSLYLRGSWLAAKRSMKPCKRHTFSGAWFLLLPRHQSALQQDQDEMPFSGEMVKQVVLYSVLLEQYPVPWCQPSLRSCLMLLCSALLPLEGTIRLPGGLEPLTAVPHCRSTEPPRAVLRPSLNQELSSPQITRTVSDDHWHSLQGRKQPTVAGNSL